MTDRPTSRRRWTIPLLLLACVAVIELIAVATGPMQRRLGFDTRRLKDVLAEQTAGIRDRLSDEDDVIVLDPEIGWRNRTHYSSTLHNTNSAGLRSAREYAPQRSPEVLRVAAFGDAFVYGAEVPTAAAWAALIEDADPAFEVLNYGVGGYGTDQAFLLYQREGQRFSPDVVVIGFSPVDLRRGVSRYTRFGSFDEPPLTKPRYKLDAAGGLVLVPNPLQGREDWERLAAEPRRVVDLGVDDAWYDALRFRNPLYDRLASVRLATAAGLRVWRRYVWRDRLFADAGFRPEASAFAVQRAVLGAFADSVRAHGATPVVVMLPDQSSVWAVQSGRGAVYAPLADTLRIADGLPVVDVVDAFAEWASAHGDDGMFAPGGHYGPVGNRVLADRLRAHLRELPQPD
jgi:hypothetical protein